MNSTIVVAHRGASGLAPENTMLAYQRAFEIGADMIELDVQETNDGELVCIHDYEVDRTTNGTGSIAELSYNEVRELTINSDQKIPSLKEVLDYCRGKMKVNIELKVTDIEEKVLKLAKERDMLSEIIVSSFFHGTLINVKELNEKVSTAILVSSLREGVIQYIRDHKADALNPHFELVTDELVTTCHQNGIKIFPWTVNDSLKMSALFDLDIDGIISDHPDIAIEVLKKRGL
jgi:glycerophosphoryl diester phosphodiesterase